MPNIQLNTKQYPEAVKAAVAYFFEQFQSYIDGEKPVETFEEDWDSVKVENAYVWDMNAYIVDDPENPSFRVVAYPLRNWKEGSQEDYSSEDYDYCDVVFHLDMSMSDEQKAAYNAAGGEQKCANCASLPAPHYHSFTDEDGGEFRCDNCRDI